MGDKDKRVYNWLTQIVLDGLSAIAIAGDWKRITVKFKVFNDGTCGAEWDMSKANQRKTGKT